MEVWLLRHAEAEDRAASGRDEDRGLTAGGLAQAKAVARGIAALAPAIRVILTSPLLRARQTAEPLAEVLGLAAIRPSRALEPGSDPEAILSELEEAGEESLLLVGHAPQLGRLLGRLVTGEADGDIPVSKAGAACVSFEGLERRGRLRAFLPARVLERLGVL
ncbi:MAG TPA: phosphohistidine phosphatase SixA [Thermoanaerobaculia bacterium]|nr:phosphohistidine phosphatase SixA [Thermoanaerobaculia bacterium]